MVCPKCHSEQPNNAKFCSECGSELKPTPSKFKFTPSVILSILKTPPSCEEEKTDRINIIGTLSLFAAIIVAAFILIFAAAFPPSTKPSNSYRPYSSSSTASQSFLSSDDLFTIDEIIKSSCEKSNITVYKTEYHASAKLYVISIIPTSGVAIGLLDIETNPSTQEQWRKIKNNYCEWCLEFKDTAKQISRLNINVQVNILNDFAYDKVLLSVLNGVVIYDCTTE